MLHDIYPAPRACRQVGCRQRWRSGMQENPTVGERNRPRATSNQSAALQSMKRDLHILLHNDQTLTARVGMEIGFYYGAAIAEVDLEETVSGITVCVPRGRLAPGRSLSSRLMASTLRDLDGKRILDLGTGTGVLALEAAKNGAMRVCASDIDPICCRAAEANLNAYLERSTFLVREGDGLTRWAGEHFDLIIANLPIRPYVPEGFWRQRLSAEMYRSLIDPDHLALRTVLECAHGYLVEGGAVRFTLADFADTPRLREEAERNAWNWKPLAQGENEYARFEVIECRR